MNLYKYVCWNNHLYSQRECVEHDEYKHDVLKLRGVDDPPELELGRIFGDVYFYRLGFQCVLHTLSLGGRERARERGRGAA